MTTPKAEALAALVKIQDTLVGPGPIDGLVRNLLSATVAYAIAEVEKIEELKRKRKKGA